MPLKRAQNSDRIPTVMQIKALVDSANHELVNEALALMGDIQEKFYTGQSGSSLGRRTGQAVRGWQVKHNKETVSILNNIPHADHSKERTIKPKSSKYLAIPVDKALTPAGVARYDGPRDSALPKLSIARLKNKDGYILFDSKGRDERITNAYFILKKQVKIPARTRGLTPFVQKEASKIADRIGDFIFKGWNNLSEGLK